MLQRQRPAPASHYRRLESRACCAGAALLSGVLHLLWPAPVQAAEGAAATALAESAQRWADDIAFSGVLELRRGQQTLARIERGAGLPVATGESSFWIGSVSKQFAAVAALKLAERGALRLQAPVTELLPALGTEALSLDGVRCSVEHLLSHTCGLPRDLSSDHLRSANHLKDAARARRLLEEVAAERLRFVPGTHYEYSNAGYDLVGLLLQSVAGQPYEALLRHELWAPLGMTSTGITPRPGAEPARGETGLGPLWVDAARWLLLDVTTPAAFGASGNAYSTVSDLLRWNDALHHGQLLSPSSYASFIAPRHGKYGLGVALSEKPFGLSLNHTGSHVPHSSSALLVYVPGQDLSLAGVANRTFDTSGLSKLADALVAQASGVPATAPARPGVSDWLHRSVPLLTLAFVGLMVLSVLRRCFDRKAVWDWPRWWLQYHAAALGLAALALRWRPEVLDPLLCVWGVLALGGAWYGRYWALPGWRSNGSWQQRFELAGCVALLLFVLAFTPRRIAWLAGTLVVLELVPVSLLILRRSALRRASAGARG